MSLGQSYSLRSFCVSTVTSSEVHCEKEDGTNPFESIDTASTTTCTYIWKDSSNDERIK